jgi:hypothetical protein
MASITCGNCKETHYSVQEVKDCYSGRQLNPVGPLAQRFDLPGPWPTAQPAAQTTPKRAEPASEPKRVGDGYYRHNNIVYKVQWNRERTHLYGKELNPNTGKWIYTPGILAVLRTEDKLTKEQAAEFGKLYGICCICGRTLTNEESIEAGIGPICAGKVFG